jgi:hypothetical protein
VTLTKMALSNPVAVVVAGILIAIFGILSLSRRTSGRRAAQHSEPAENAVQR